MKILITAIGGVTPRSVAIALKKHSFYRRFELYGTDANPLAVGHYQNELFTKTFIIPPFTSSKYWGVIDELVAKYEIDAAIICPEDEVMEWGRRQESGKLPCKALIPDYALTKIIVDKSKLTELLKGLDIVPPSVTFTRDTKNLHGVFDVLKTNFWVRSSSGTSGLGSLKVEDEDSLKNWIQINPKVEKFIASKFLPGRNLACKMLYYNGQLIRTACGERVNYIMAKVAPSGITGNTSFGRLLNEPGLVKEATRAMDHIFEQTGAKKHGFFTADFKEDENGKPYITEVNVRHVAFTQCFAAAGANFVADTVKLLNDDPGFNKDYKMYEFEKDLIFLRDVDALPILMKETELLSQTLF